MRTKSATFFECKVRYYEQNEKLKTGNFCIPASSFAVAEMTVKKEVERYAAKDSPLDVTAISIAPYKDIILSDSDKADKFYKIRLDFITINENNGKEKKTAVYYLVQAASVEDARKSTDEMMSQTMIDYTIVSVVETTIMDVFEYYTT